ncbi:MAG: DUF3189 family protein [Bacillota bacterium]
MKIVFLCPTGTFSSLTAAHLYLGNISRNTTVKEILELPYYGEFTAKTGLFFYIGKDKGENLIYTLGISNEPNIIMKSAYDLLTIKGIPREHLVFCDVSKYVPYYLVFLNRYFPNLTKKIIAKILKKNFNSIQKEIEYIS